MIVVQISKSMENQFKEKNITPEKIEEIISCFLSVNDIDVSVTTKSETKPGTFPLSKQHQKIIHLSSLGYTYSEISEKLGITVSTVKFHIKRIKDIMGVSTLSQVIKVATSSDLI